MVTLALYSMLLAGFDVKKDVVYRTVDDKPVLMDIYTPEKPITTPPPVVVMIHGGAWISGSKNDMSKLAIELANRGVAVANIDYRLAPKSKWPAMIDDCQEAVLFVKRHATEYGFDSDSVGAIGGSAGAHLSLLLGSTDRGQFSGGAAAGSGPNARVSAIVNLFGPVDMREDFEKNTANFVSLQVLGKKYEDAKEEQKAFSPITYFSKSSAPTYTIHGTADTLVPVKQAHRLDDALKGLGVEHEMVIIEGMPHGVSSKDEKVNEKIMTELGKALDWLVAKLSAK